MREIERRTPFTIGTIQTELKKLKRLDLVTKRRDGNRLYYRANDIHPLYPDIRNIILKTTGLTDIIRERIGDESGIEYAFVFGSLTKGNENAKSDVDLFIIGETGLRRIFELLSGASEQIGREINPYAITVDEFIKRKSNEDHFISQIIQESKIFIKGNEHDFRKLAG